MSTGPLQIHVVPAGEVDLASTGRVLARSRALASSLSQSSDVEPAFLDDLLFQHGAVNSGWRDELLDFIRGHAAGGEITYAVAGDPLAGDATVQQLLALQETSDIAVRVERPKAVDSLEQTLAGFPAPHIYVDSLTLLEIDAGSPFAGGSFPLSSNQTTVVTNLERSTVECVRRILERHFGTDVAMYGRPDGDSPVAVPVTPPEPGRDVEELPDCLIIPAASGNRFYRSSDDLQRLVARLRAPGGCPWDRKQTNGSLTRNLIEESYELLEAIESGDVDDMREEMGDFLLQAFLHCQITGESGRFTLEDVFDTLITKLVRRHPHVFATAEAGDADQVVQNWDEIKRAERAEKPASANGGPLGNVPVSLPALSRAQTLLKRARRTGAVPDNIAQRRDDAVAGAAESPDDAKILGNLIAGVDTSVEQDIDLEELVRRWTRAFEQSFDPNPTGDSND